MSIKTTRQIVTVTHLHQQTLNDSIYFAVMMVILEQKNKDQVVTKSETLFHKHLLDAFLSSVHQTVYIVGGGVTIY